MVSWPPKSYKCLHNLIATAADQNLLPSYQSLLHRKLYQHRHCKLSYCLAAAPHLLWTGKVAKSTQFPAGVQETTHALDFASSQSLVTI